MKSTSIFKKALIFAVVMVLSLVTVISVIPAFAADTGHGETLKASNISISGEITMLYYFTGLDSNGYDADRDYVRVTIPQREEGKYTVIDTKIKDLDQDKGRWIVPVSVPYAQQTAEYTIQFFQNGVGGKVRTRTVKAYADTVLSLAAAGNTNYTALVEPIKNMLNAGAMAQLAFKYVDKEKYPLANAELFPDANVNPVNDMLPEHFYDVEDKPEQSKESTYIKFLGGQALLDSAITLRIFVNCPDAVTSAQVSNGNVTQTVKLRVDDQGRKYVSIRNIAATAFNTRYKVSLTYADDTVSYSYSVLDYAIDALESPSSVVDPEMKNVVRALYLFYAQTTKYVDDSYVPGPKDENGAAADCDHERSYAKDGDLVCPDCGHTEALANTTKLGVAIVGTPEIIAGENSRITLAFSINGTANNLSGVLFTPKCDGVTFTLDRSSVSYNSDKFTVTADNNLLVLENNGEALTGELVTATYTVNAPAGLHKVSIALREAADANGNDIQVAGLVTGIATFEATARDCGEGNHRFTKYANMSETKHIAICETCGAQVEEEHEFTEVTETENGIRTYKNACVCGNTKAFYVAKVLTAGINNGIKLTANTAGYSWVADNASSINIVCPELAVDYDLVLTNSNGTSVSMSADAYNGILSMYVLAGEVVNAKLVAQAGTIANLDVQVYAGAGSAATLDDNLEIDIDPYRESGNWYSAIESVDDGIKITTNGFTNPKFTLGFNNNCNTGKYLAITYKANHTVATDSYFYSYVDANGNAVGMATATKVQSKKFTFEGDGQWHTMIVDVVASMAGSGTEYFTHTDCKITAYRLNFYNISADTEIVIKSMELSDDLDLLNDKYGPEYGTAENPKPIDSIASITTKLKAGDSDGYFYKYTTEKSGFYTFTLPKNATYDIIVTANGSTASCKNDSHNGYLSVYAKAGSDVIVNVISTKPGYGAVTATVNSVFTNGASGSDLKDGSGIEVGVYSDVTVTADSEGATVTGGAGDPNRFTLDFPAGNNNGKYLAITYKASKDYNFYNFYYKYITADGTTSPFNDTTRTNSSSAALKFVGDGKWHTVIVNVETTMAGSENVDHTGCKILHYRVHAYDMASGDTITFKSFEFSDDKAYLEAKHAGTYGTAEAPKPLDSITSITHELEAGDSDGYFYKYTATNAGFYTFTLPQNANYDIVVTANGSTVSYAENSNNGYLSVFANTGEDIVIQAISTTAGYPAVAVTANCTFTNGAIGLAVKDSADVELKLNANATTTVTADGITYTATASNPKPEIFFPNGSNEGRYLAITYKATTRFYSADFYYSYYKPDGSYVSKSEATRTQSSTYCFDFQGDGEWHTMIIDTLAYMSGKTDKNNDHTGCKVNDYRINFSNIAINSELTIKSVELSDDKAFLDAKYAPAMGSKSNPEVLDSVSSINVNLKAGDTDGYYYQWTATETGICTFTIPDGLDLSVTTNGSNVSYKYNGLLSVGVDAGDVVTINAIATGDGKPATTATVTSAFSDGAYGSDLKDGSAGIRVAAYADVSVNIDSSGATITGGNSTSNRFTMDFPAGNNDGKYMAITYKASKDYNFYNFYYKYLKADGTTSPFNDSTRTNAYSAALVFGATSEWKTVIFNVEQTMAGTENVDHTGCKILHYRIHAYDMAEGDTLTIKSIEFSDDFALLTAKYGGAPKGSTENPELLGSIDSFNVSLKAGDSDGYTYKYTAPKNGIYTFTIPENAAYNVIVTADGSTVNYTSNATNGYLSVYALANSDIIVKVISTGDGYPATEATVTGRYSYGTIGNHFAGGSSSNGDITVSCENSTHSASNDGSTFTTTADCNPTYNISFGNRTENERYMVITYKSNGFYDTDRYYCGIIKDGVRTYNESTGFNRAVAFTNDNEWHVMVIDTYAFMTGTTRAGTVRDSMDGNSMMDALRLDFRNVTSGSTFTVKAIELSNDVDYLEAKYGVSIGE